MTRPILPAALAAALLSGAPASATPDPALAMQLEARTQALQDAIAPDNKQVWDHEMAPGYIMVTENAEVQDRATFLHDLTPLPAGLVGSIKVVDYRLERHGNMAFATYVDDESLDYHGVALKTKFRISDSWVESGGDWKLAGTQIIAVLDDPPAITLPASTLSDYVGHYVLPDGTASDIVLDTSGPAPKLVSRRAGRPDSPLLAEARDVFFVPGSPRSRKVFYRDSSGKVTGYGDRREGHDIPWRKVPA
jgi:hypothetical protein